VLAEEMDVKDEELRETIKKLWPIQGNAMALILVPPKEGLDAATAILLMISIEQKGKGSPYSISERRVPELIPVLCSQPAGDVSHKPDGRIPLLTAKPPVTLATLMRAATSFAAW